MASDFRIVAQPLNKQECLTCGLATHTTQRIEFDASYALYAHAPGRKEEARRQALYAQWITGLVPEPSDVFEAGSGNGSLLLALAAHWRNAKFSGIEPAARAVESARREGLHVEKGFLSAIAAPASDLAFAVNVLEHAPDPNRFVAALASRTSRHMIIIVPDGSRPNIELLIADHLYSFSFEHIRMLTERAGFATVKQLAAPAELGAFFATVAIRDGEGARGFGESTRSNRARYLSAWGSLDQRLVERLGRVGEIGCFGAGEAAALLRAYVPETWSQVHACFVDDPHEERFGSLPVAQVEKAPQTLLLGVRPQAQSALAERLQRLGHRVIRWDDIIAS